MTHSERAWLALEAAHSRQLARGLRAWAVEECEREDAHRMQSLTAGANDACAHACAIERLIGGRP